MSRTGIVIKDRWRDPVLSTSERIVLIPSRDRCDRDHRYLAQAWDPRANPTKPGKPHGRYESATFPTKAEAHAWATKRRAEFIAGTSSAKKPIWQEIGYEYLESLKLRMEKPVTPRYLAQMAEQAFQGSRWPLEVKLHGDFRSRRLKNTPDELRKQDERLLRVLIDSCHTSGLIVVGYSGRDDSIAVTPTTQ